MPLCRIPPALRGYTGGRDEVDLPAGGSVRAVLEALEARHPGLLRCVCDELGRVRPHVNLFVNDENTRFAEGLDTPVREGDELWILPAVSGGLR